MKLKKDFSKMSLDELISLVLVLQEKLSRTQEQLNQTEERLNRAQEQLSHSQTKLIEVQAKFDQSQLLVQKLKNDNDRIKAELARAKKSRLSQG